MDYKQLVQNLQDMRQLLDELDTFQNFHRYNNQKLFQ